mgnify:CR=1 FL=1
MVCETLITRSSRIEPGALDIVDLEILADLALDRVVVGGIARRQRDGALLGPSIKRHPAIANAILDVGIRQERALDRLPIRVGARRREHHRDAGQILR